MAPPIIKLARRLPAKKQAGKAGVRLGKRKAQRTEAARGFYFGQALLVDRRARNDLGRAAAAAGSAYRRVRGQDTPALIALLDDRRASKQAGLALRLARQAASTASSKRKRPENRRRNTLLVVGTTIGVGGAAAVYRRRKADDVPPTPAPAEAPPASASAQ